MPKKQPQARDVQTPSIFTVSPYSSSVAEEMYPAQRGTDDQRDAARHMLVAGTLARKYGVAPAEFIGKMYEWGSTPMDTLKMMMGSAPKADYLMDLHNNAYGAQLGVQARSQGELEDMVQREAERAQLNAPADRAMLIPPSVKPKGYAIGGAVKSGIKAAKEAKATPTSVLEKIRSLFAAEPEQALEAIGNVPMSRRGFLRTTASPAVQAGIRAVAPELAGALPSVSQVVKPAAVRLTPEVKTGAMNLMANVARMSRAPSALDRASLVSEAVPEGMSLKQFMREVKTEPDVYNTMMKDVERLGLEERFGQAYGIPKEDYMSTLKNMNLPEGSMGRESKLWDKYGGSFKEPKSYVSENVKPRMFDVDMSAPDWFYDLDSATRERLKDKLMGTPTDEALDKLKAFKQVFAPQMKLQAQEASDLYGQIAKAQSVSPLTIPAALSGLNSRVGRVLEIDMPYGVSPSLERINRMTPTELPLSQLEYDMQLEAAKDALSRSIYDKSYRKGYNALGLEIPEYVPSEKAQFRLGDTPKPENFAKGGAVSADEQASFGVFPQMKPRRAKQDREAAKDAPAAALRGYVAGTLGLPGGLEGLARMLIPGVSDESYLPDSEYFRKVLPLRSLQDTPTGRAFTELGGAAGGAGLATGAKLAGRGAGAVARAGAEQIARAVEAGHPLTAGFAPMNVIKPKGGQWLSGSVEESLRGLGGRMNTMSETPQVLQKYGLTSEELTAIPLPERAKMYEEFLTPANRAAQSMDKFVQGPLTKYVKTQMATPEDPVRAMAERGVLHYTPQADDFNVTSLAARMLRKNEGFPVEGLAQSNLAKRWENASDVQLSNPQASIGGYSKIMAENPWLAKLNPTDPVYRPHSPRSLGSEVGFGHLTDELKNALNPESGLPRHLQLTPEQMQGYGVEKAVQRVADINAWRQAQKVAADEKLATSPAAVMFKEYPGEANPRGLHWRELKQPEMPIEGSIVENPNPQFGTPFEYVAPDGTVLRRERTRAELEKNIARDAKAAGYKPLQEQLKYEGDTMGHCVGGYCEEVASGKSQIYSLRDAKGQPHVTIEVQPSKTLTPEKRDAQVGFLVQRLLGEGMNEDQALAQAHKLYPESETASRIVQIKGKGNKAPKEEYLPMVQDFVKSGKWSDVGDLQNAGLIDARAAGKPLPGRPSFMTNEEFKAFQNETRNPEPGFAAGGLVNDSISGYNPARVDEIVNSLRTELFQ